MPAQIRRAGDEYAAEIVALKAAVWPDDKHSQAQVLRALQQPDHAARIALSAAGRVAGFVDSFPTSALDGRIRWEVDLLAVHPDFQGQKIGRQLIEAATQAGRDAGASFARALIQVDNHASQGAFRRCGYGTDKQVCRLMISSDRQAGAVQTLDSAVLIPVVTMNYSGLWLEGAITPAHLAAARIEHTRRGLDLSGVLIRDTDSAALSAAERTGYSFIEAFQWWTHSL
jgi:ribosomal protein S18 acetylase RimI-like enzyme